MVFRPTPLQIPNMRTDYSGETRAFEQLGQTLGNLIPDMQKQQRANAEREEMARIGKGITDGTLDYKAAAGRAFALNRADLGMELLKQGETQAQRALGMEATRNLGSALGQYFGGQPTVGLGTSPTSSPGSTSSALSPSLISNESGGNWQAQNNEVGAGGARGHFGRGQFGVARIQEAANAGAIPQGTTPQQFMNSPELQQRAERWHVDNIDQNIRANGFDRLIGQRINGVPITIDGLRAVAHLGGVNGMKKFVETQGGYNPSDANGTSLFDYFSRHGGTRSAEADLPVQGATPVSMETGQEGFSIPPGGSMSGRTFQQIAGGLDNSPLRPAFEAEGLGQPWMGSTLAPSLQRAVGGAPQSQTAQVMPPRRPYDLNEADLPARGAVPAIGQMPPQAAARYADADPTRDDAGMRIGQLASEEARRGLPSGASVTNFLDNFRSAPQQAAPAGFTARNPQADLPAPGASQTIGTMPPSAVGVPANAGAAAQPAGNGRTDAATNPVPSSELPRPTNAQEVQEYRWTKQIEGKQRQIGALAQALANPNLPANARGLGEIFLKEALEQSKAPEAVKEFMYAKGMGWTTAKTPAEYAAEKEKAKKTTAEDETAGRERAAARAGLKPGDPGYQGFILTGKMPREDMGPLSATDKKAIMEADDAVQSAQTAIKSLQDAKKLSPQALGGWGASAKAAIANNLWDGIVPDRLVGSPQQGQATAELDNVVTSQALAQLKSIFGAAPTEGERKILLDIQGSIGQPDNVRQKIFDRGIELAQRRLEFNRQRAAELRGGDYYKTPEKRSQGGNSEPQGSAPVPGARQAGDGNWYVPDPNRQGKYLRVN